MRSEGPECVADDTGWRERVDEAKRRGDYLATFDLARAGLKQCPDSLRLHYAAILALARSGATRGARAMLDELRSSGKLAGIQDRDLERDFATLDGRFAKDDWARAEGEAKRGHARRSAESYAKAFGIFGGHYPAINAATMFLAAGDGEAARRFARDALDDAAANPKDYWSCASAAEASLILGETRTAGTWLERAAGLGPDFDDLASTRRQILFVASETGTEPAVVDLLRAPPVRYWLDDGAPVHRLPGRAPPGPSLESAPGIAYGTLVDAADVRRAARLAERGVQIYLVMPCEPPAWLEGRDAAEAEAVQPSLEDVLKAAKNVVFVTREGRPDDPAALDLCRRQVRGLARLRARELAVAPHRIAWARRTNDEPEIGPDDDTDIRPHDGPGVSHATRGGSGREPRAIVFGDVRGFSQLGEAAQLRFLDRIVGGFGDVIKGERVDYAETAGDGIYVVLADVESAARCCFQLRDVLDPARVAAAGLPKELGLRLSAHVGPLYRRFDRVIDRVKFCGSEVIRTARIEPVTPVGEIYVTEQFAAALADVTGHAYACDYVGRQPMAKNFGYCRMYALRRSRE